MIDHNNLKWTRNGEDCTCEDGRALRIVPEMTDAYLLTVIASFDAPQIPQTVSMRQARLALLGAGLLLPVSQGIAQMPMAAQIEWEFASEVRRDSPLIGLMADALGLTSASIDALFIDASGR